MTRPHRLASSSFSWMTALLLAAAPAAAGDFALFGSYWDTDDAGHAGGGGISLGIPFNSTVGMELRATYFEQLSDHPLDNLFHSDSQVFREAGINVTPLEVGLRFNLGSGGVVSPYLAAGAGYYLLDSDFGELNDEVGWYGGLGLTIGDPTGASFFAEALYRRVEGQVKLDPDDLEDLDDLDIQGKADLKLDGLGVNAGVRWRF